MKKIILFLAVLLAFTANVPKFGCVELVSQAYAESKEESEGGSDKIEYYDLEPLVLPIIDVHGASQMIHLSVSLELAEDTDRDDITPYTPRLADAFLNEMYGALGEGYGVTRAGTIDIAYLKKRMTEITTRVLGPDKVTSVLIQAVHQQRM